MSLFGTLMLYFSYCETLGENFAEKRILNVVVEKTIELSFVKILYIIFFL